MGCGSPSFQSFQMMVIEILGRFSENLRVVAGEAECGVTRPAEPRSDFPCTMVVIQFCLSTFSRVYRALAYHTGFVLFCE